MAYHPDYSYREVVVLNGPALDFYSKLFIDVSKDEFSVPTKFGDAVYRVKDYYDDYFGWYVGSYAIFRYYNLSI